MGQILHHVKQKNIPDKTAWALPGKCTKSAFGHGLARAPVGALAGNAGAVGAVSKVSQRSRSVISALEHVGKHSGGSVGCSALSGSAGI